MALKTNSFWGQMTWLTCAYSGTVREAFDCLSGLPISWNRLMRVLVACCRCPRCGSAEVHQLTRTPVLAPALGLCSRTLLRASLEKEAWETCSPDEQEEKPQNTTGASESAKSMMPSIFEDAASGHDETGQQMSEQPRRVSLHDRRSDSPPQPNQFSFDHSEAPH